MMADPRIPELRNRLQQARLVQHSMGNLDDSALVHLVSTGLPATDERRLVQEILSQEGWTGRLASAAPVLSDAGAIQACLDRGDRYLLERLATNPKLPPAILEQLCRHSEKSVSGPARRQRAKRAPRHPRPKSLYTRLADHWAHRDRLSAKTFDSMLRRHLQDPRSKTLYWAWVGRLVRPGTAAEHSAAFIEKIRCPPYGVQEVVRALAQALQDPSHPAAPYLRLPTVAKVLETVQREYQQLSTIESREEFLRVSAIAHIYSPWWIQPAFQAMRNPRFAGDYHQRYPDEKDAIRLAPAACLKAVLAVNPAAVEWASPEALGNLLVWGRLPPNVELDCLSLENLASTLARVRHLEVFGLPKEP